MSSTTIAAPVDASRALRRSLADAVECIRTLPLTPGDAAIVREVAAIALGSLSMVLFTDTDTDTDTDDEVTRKRLLAPLVAGDLARIAELLDTAEPGAQTVEPSARPR
jgi:hypothetical protein